MFKFEKNSEISNNFSFRNQSKIINIHIFQVKCARGAHIVPDVKLEDVETEKFDIVILPGGQPGSNTLAESLLVRDVLKSQVESGGLIGAICAAPIALLSHGVKAELVTSHPSVKEKLEKGGTAGFALFLVKSR